MLIAGLVVACLLLTAQTVVFIKAYNRVDAKYNNWIKNLSNFFSQTTPDTPSHFNQVVDSIAVLFADRQRIAMTAADRGAQGAAVRDVNRGLEEIAAENSPAAAVMASLPRSLKKNNLAQAGLMMLIQNIMSKNNPGPGPGKNDGGGQSEFTF